MMNDELWEGRLKPTAPTAMGLVSSIHHSSFIVHHFPIDSPRAALITLLAAY
jgi:hypothetical protein